MKKYSLNMYADAQYSEQIEVEAENEEEAIEKATIKFEKMLVEGECEFEVYDAYSHRTEEIEA